MVRRAAALLFVAGLAGVASASPLERLTDSTLLPSTRADIVETACAPESEVTARELRSLFPRCERPEQIALARIARCRQDPALAAVMMEVFLHSKLSLGESDHDPDIFERLLRGMLELPPAALSAAIDQLDVSWIAEASWTALEEGWLAPIAGPGRLRPPRTVRGEAGDAIVREMLQRQFASGRDGLLRLQTDSGDAATKLLDRLQTMHLAALVAEAPPDELELVAEVLRQRDDPSPLLLPSVAARLPDAPVLAEIHAELVARGLEAEAPTPLYDPAEAVEPVVMPPGDWVTRGEERGPARSPWWGALAALGVGLLGWIAALRLLPARREALFRSAVVVAPVAAVVAVEGVLAVSGVAPPPGLVDIVSLTRGYDESFDARALEGEDWIVSTDPRMRAQQFRPTKAPGTLRVATLGESSAHAANYLVEEGFSARLGAHLDAALPQEVEMIHAGIGGALSSQIRRVAAELLDWDADLLVLYFGNNDLDFLPEVVRYDGFELDRLRRHTALGRVRVIGFPSRWLQDVNAVGSAFVGAREGAPLTEDELAEVITFAREHAIANIAAVVDDARRHDAEVIIVAQGPRDEVRGIGIEAAAATGATLVDGAGAVEAHARAAGLAGRLEGSPYYDRYYWDYVHPTRLGHAVLAAAIAPAAAEALADRTEGGRTAP